MNNYLVLYLAPASMMEEWKKTPPEKRKIAEEKMRKDWKTWTSQHAKMFADMGAGAGKTKRVTAQGAADTKNDIMMYAIVNAESQDAAAKLFSGHPHLQFPKTSIEIMELHKLPGM
ncbi:MAG TPA: hypothetical protein VGN77_01485 [Steroidobacteraceae bacterium]|nr:hypothetical protein [Steroidobacteraceae bacterium]